MDCLEGLVKKFGLYLVGNREPALEDFFNYLFFTKFFFFFLARSVRIKAN